MTYDQAVGWPEDVSAAFCVKGFFSSSLEDTPQPSGMGMPRTFHFHPTDRADYDLPRLSAPGMACVLYEWALKVPRSCTASTQRR